MVSSPKQDDFKNKYVADQARQPATPSPRPGWAEGRALLPVSEVATACGVSQKTVRRWIDLEALPCIRLRAAGDRQMTFIRPSDLDAWLLRHRHDTSETGKDDRTVRIEGGEFASFLAEDKE